METPTIKVDADDFSKILDTAEILINEVEQVFSQDEVIKDRIKDIQIGGIKGKTEEDYNEYLRKRGIRFN